MAIRFVHTADIHFGVENYGSIDSQTGLHSRLIDFKNSFNYIVNYAIEENVDCFIFAGDAYKNSFPTPTQQRILIKLFLKLLDNNIPVVIIVGNHDHIGNSIKAHALDVFYHIKHPLCLVFSKPGLSIIHTKSGPIQIIGVPWPFPAVIAKGKKINSSLIKSYVLNEINTLKKSLNPDYPTVLVGHLTMANGIFSGSEKNILENRDPLFTADELSDDRINYIALGHLHRYQYINEKIKNQNPIVYSGSPDRIDFGEKDDNKSCCVVTVSNKKKTEFFLLPIPCRPFYQIYLHIESLDDAKEKIKEEILKYKDIEKAIIKIRYSYNYQYIKYIDISFLQNLLSHVWHIASIECINNYKMKKKEQRTIFHENKNIHNMVESYIDSNESFKKEKNSYMNTLKEYINGIE
jgi:exonuclease SbcD